MTDWYETENGGVAKAALSFFVGVTEQRIIKEGDIYELW